MLRLTYSN